MPSMCAFTIYVKIEGTAAVVACGRGHASSYSEQSLASDRMQACLRLDVAAEKTKEKRGLALLITFAHQSAQGPW